MCGIGGFSGNFSPDLLNKINNAQAHRGPDDGEIIYFADDRIGLSHRRLSIIDLSKLGKQPMYDCSEKAIIVFNGEIYNFKELRDELLTKGVQFKSKTDTEVLINLYLQYGTNMLSRLNGIFAFAIWDINQKQLFCARDQLGVKPFYYCQLPDGFLFASEIKSLLQCESVPREINYSAIHNYLTFLWCPAPNTMLKQVKKLLPGHALIIKNGKIEKMWEYYDLPFNSIQHPTSLRSAIEQCDDLLQKAVSRQMISDSPLGAFLSGGLDSSSIVSFAHKYASTTLQCFTIGFSNDEFKKESSIDDLPFAEKTASHFGVDLHKIIVGHEIVKNLSKMIFYLDEPQADPAAIHTYLICNMARQKGIKVLLSGTGGDDIFSGYRRHLALNYEKYQSYIPSLIKNYLAIASSTLPKKITLFRRIAKIMEYLRLSGDEKIASYFQWINPENLFPLYSKPVLDQLTCDALSSPLLQSLKKLNPNTPSLNKMLYLEGKHFLADHNLNYTDKMGMAAGVEIRVPLLDLDLVRFAAQLPTNYKQHGKTGKWIFRKTMEPYLPHNVIYRKKTGFGAPVRFWVRGPLKPFISDLLSEKSLSKRGIFNPTKVTALIDNDHKGIVDASYTILSLVCIELWCRNFIDQKTPSEPSDLEL